MSKPPIDHGTRRGYNQHKRRGSEPCEPCRKAAADYQKARRLARKHAAESGEPVRNSVERANTRKNAEARGAEIVETATGKRTYDDQGRPIPPDYLRAAGKRRWREITDEYRLKPAALQILGDACRLIDTTERLSAALSNRDTLWFELGDQPDDPTQGVPIVVNGMLAARESALKTYAQMLAKIGVIAKAEQVVEDDDISAFLAEAADKMSKM